MTDKVKLEDHAHQQIIHKGDIIFMEDEHLQKLFCIREGACKFSTIDDNGKEHITQLLGKGELMGRRSLISKKGAMVTATAITDGSLCCVNKEPILNSLQKNTNFCIDVLKGFVGDTEEDRLKLELFQNQRSIKKRLAGLLIYIKEKFGTQKNGCLNVSLKREDMANILGTSSEYIITLLSSFKKDSIITLNKGKINILSLERLQEII